MQSCESTKRLCEEELSRSEASTLCSFWETRFLSAALFTSFFECFQELKTYERWWYQSLLYSVQKHCESVDEETDFECLWENHMILAEIAWKDADKNNCKKRSEFKWSWDNEVWWDIWVDDYFIINWEALLKAWKI